MEHTSRRRAFFQPAARRLRAAPSLPPTKRSLPAPTHKPAAAGLQRKVAAATRAASDGMSLSHARTT